VSALPIEKENGALVTRFVVGGGLSARSDVKT